MSTTLTTEAERDEAARALRPLAREIAGGFSVRLPRSVSFDELEAAALYGLAQALRGYRPEAPASLRTYASHRMRGAVYDWLRERDQLKRCQRDAGLDVIETRISEAVPDRRAAVRRRREDLRDEVDFLLSLLPPRLAYALRLRYLEGLTLDQVAERLGVSASRVWQLFHRARGLGRRLGGGG